MEIKDFASVTIGLSVTPPSQATFGTSMLLIDHADIPVDKRYIITTRSSYATDLTASTEQYSFAQTLWGQNFSPDKLYLGRWISAATAAYMYFPSADQTAATYAALAATAQLKITEGLSDEDINPDFTGDTTMADVAASIQVALAAGTLTASYTCSIDKQGRLVIYSDNTGSTADAVSAGTPAAGVDLTLTLGAEVSVAGFDAETLGQAAAAVFELDNTPFVVCERGASTSEQVAFATSMNSYDKLTLLVVNDTDAKNPALSTDAGYQIKALGYNKIHVEYTEHTTQNPDASICGEIFPQTEATTDFALWPLTGVSQSGLAGDGTTVIPLTAAERTALDAKGYDYLAKPATVTHFVRGLAPGGNELRIMYGKLFCEAKISEDIYGYMVSQKVVTFSDEDITAIKSIFVFWLDEMVKRKVIDAGYTITMPEAADFTAAAKATHQMDLDDIANAETQRSVTKVVATLNWGV